MGNRKQLSEISVPGRIGLVIVGTVQVVFAFLAFWDLAHRSADEVRGPRLAWVPAIRSGRLLLVRAEALTAVSARRSRTLPAR